MNKAMIMAVVFMHPVLVGVQQVLRPGTLAAIVGESGHSRRQPELYRVPGPRARAQRSVRQWPLVYGEKPCFRRTVEIPIADPGQASKMSHASDYVNDCT
jgi:hypothetical protein